MHGAVDSPFLLVVFARLGQAAADVHHAVDHDRRASHGRPGREGPLGTLQLGYAGGLEHAGARQVAAEGLILHRVQPDELLRRDLDDDHVFFHLFQTVARMRAGLAADHAETHVGIVELRLDRVLRFDHQPMLTVEVDVAAQP